MSRSDRRGGSTMRGVLIAILIVLCLLLAGLGYFIVSILEPVGAPSSSDVPAELEWVRSIYGYGPGPDEQFVAPGRTEIAPDGTIWVSDTQLNSVFAFAPDGSLRRRIELSALSPDQPWTVPKGISVSEDSELYVCASNADRILVMTETGDLLRSWDVSRPLDCQVAGDRIYVTGAAGVSVFSLDGDLVGSWGGRGKALDQLDLPQGVVVGDDGTVFVSDTLNARVKAYSGEGALVWTTEQGTTGGGNQAMGSQEASGTGLQIPSGICIDGNGRLVLVDPFGFNMVVVDPQDGQIIARYGDFGEADGLFAYPSGVAYDSTRDWFAVADSANGRIQIVRIPDSAANRVGPAVARALVGPIWICGIPLILLVLVAIIAARSRRRPQGRDPDDEGWTAPREEPDR